MKFDVDAVKNLDSKSARNILLKSGLLFYITAIVFVVTGIVLLFFSMSSFSIFLFISAFILGIIGIKNIFLKGEKREKFLTSKLVDAAIKNEKKNGNALSYQEIDKIKFKYDPIFHDKIVSEVHTNQDNQYRINVKQAEEKLQGLKNSRLNEISRINDMRWQKVANGAFMFNVFEGKIKINGSEYFFPSIKGAEVTEADSYRVETTESGVSKKHVSVGKAAVGGVLFGPLGAIAGGTMGKTTSSGNSVANSIPTCNHLGVLVDLDGFKSEITLLSHTVDQTSAEYKTAANRAQEIISKLRSLSTQPVPQNVIKVEDEKTVRDYDKYIENAEKELEIVKSNKPTYEIPDRYLDGK